MVQVQFFYIWGFEIVKINLCYGTVTNFFKSSYGHYLYYSRKQSVFPDDLYHLAKNAPFFRIHNFILLWLLFLPRNEHAIFILYKTTLS